jgi:hypothetical protein
MKRITLSILALAFLMTLKSSWANDPAATGPALRCNDPILAQLEKGDTLKADNLNFLVGETPGTDGPNQVRRADGSKYADTDLGSNDSKAAGGNALCNSWVWYRVWHVADLNKAWTTATGADSDLTRAKAKVLRGVAVDFQAVDTKAAALNAAAGGVYQAMADLGVVDGAIAHNSVKPFPGSSVDAVSFKIAAKLPDGPAVSDDPAAQQARLDYLTKDEAALKNLWTPGDVPAETKAVVPPPEKGKKASSAPVQEVKKPVAGPDKPGTVVAAYYAALADLASQLGVKVSVSDEKTAQDAADQIAKIAADPVDTGWTQTALGKTKLDDYDLALRNQVYTNFVLVAARLKEAKALVTNGGKVSIADLIQNMEAAANPLSAGVKLNGQLTKAAKDLNSQLYAGDSDFAKMARVFDANKSNPDWIKSPQGQQITADLMATGAYAKDSKTGQVSQVPGGGVKVVASKTTPGTYDVLGADGKPLVAGITALPATADDQAKLTSSVADKIISGQPHAAQLKAFLASVKPLGAQPVTTGTPGQLVKTGPDGQPVKTGPDGQPVTTDPTGLTGAAGTAVTGQPGGTPGDLTNAMRAASGPGAAGCDNPNRNKAGYLKDLNSADAQAAALSSSQRSDAFSGIMDKYKSTAQSCADRYAAVSDSDPHNATAPGWAKQQRQAIDTECGTSQGQISDNAPPTSGTLGALRQQLLAKIAEQKQSGSDVAGAKVRNQTQASDLYKAAVISGVSGASAPLWQQVRADNFKLAKDWTDYPGFDDALLTKFISDNWTPGTAAGDANINDAAGKVKLNPQTKEVDSGSLQRVIKKTLQNWPPIVAYHKSHPNGSGSSVPTGDLKGLNKQFNSAGGN